ncbi:DUF192 domain-containing protein [Halobacteriaceae archaeon GCM10025711]
MTRRVLLVAGLVVAVVAVAALSGAGLDAFAGQRAQEAPSGTNDGEYGATVTFLDENGTTLGTVRTVVADSPDERYTGLSDTECLQDDTGMLFVYDDEGRRTFVMRRMNFSIDMVFVGSDGRVTAIHHAPVPDAGEDLKPYPGQAQWVVEVPREWTTDNGVAVGDRMQVNASAGVEIPTPDGA